MICFYQLKWLVRRVSSLFFGVPTFWIKGFNSLYRFKRASLFYEFYGVTSLTCFLVPTTQIPKTIWVRSQEIRRETTQIDRQMDLAVFILALESQFDH